ncbi:MAG: arginine repressor [Candidatus Planktophila sp.]|jgi:transcriptional regulator of arginine metabolism
MVKVLNSSSVAARRAKAISLIKAGVVHSQSDLVALLKKAGFEVTQATASRDLDELGAVRSRGISGELIYQLANTADGSIARSIALPSDLILSVEASGNLAVVRTPPGGAQFLASALDNAGLSNIIGTIAGDDTVLVVSKKASGGGELAKELLNFGLSARGGSAKRKASK